MTTITISNSLTTTSSPSTIYHLPSPTSPHSPSCPSVCYHTTYYYSLYHHQCLSIPMSCPLSTLSSLSIHFIQCVLYSLLTSLYYIHFTLYSLLSTLFTLYSTILSIHFIYFPLINPFHLPLSQNYTHYTTLHYMSLSSHHIISSHHPRWPSQERVSSEWEWVSGNGWPLARVLPRQSACLGISSSLYSLSSVLHWRWYAVLDHVPSPCLCPCPCPCPCP